MNYNPKAKLYSFIFLAIACIIAVNVFNSFNYPAKKDKLLIDFVEGIAFKDCQQSQKAYDQMLKVDPDEKYVYKYLDLMEHLPADLTHEQLKQYLNMCYSSKVSKNAKNILEEAIVYQHGTIDEYLRISLHKN